MYPIFYLFLSPLLVCIPFHALSLSLLLPIPSSVYISCFVTGGRGSVPKPVCHSASCHNKLHMHRIIEFIETKGSIIIGASLSEPHSREFNGDFCNRPCNRTFVVP